MCLESALNTIRLSDPADSHTTGYGYDNLRDSDPHAYWCTDRLKLESVNLDELKDLDLIFAHADESNIKDVLCMEELVDSCADIAKLPKTEDETDGWHLVAIVNASSDPKVGTITVNRCGIDVIGFTEFVAGSRTPWAPGAVASLVEGDRVMSTTVIVYVPPESVRGFFAIRLTPPLPPGIDFSGDKLIEHLGQQIQILTDFIKPSSVKALQDHQRKFEDDYGGLPKIRLPLPVKQEQGYLITQGFGGRLTHYHPNTLYSIDIRADIGTPILAPADATVVKIQDDATCASGIHVDNLYSFNSVMIQLHGSIKGFVEGIPDLESTEEHLYVEYTHLSPSSASSILKVGDTVKAGDMVARVGNIGFCPEPHLHMQLYTSPQDDALPIKYDLCNLDPMLSSISPYTISKNPHLKDLLNNLHLTPERGMILMPLKI